MASRPIRLRRVALAGLLIAIGVLGAAAPVSAHANLVISSPAASAVLESGPTEISLDFTEPVSVIEGSVELFGEAGTAVDIGPAEVDANDPARVVVQEVPALEQGQYVVAWRVLSADGHVAEGAFSFLVGSSGSLDDDAAANVLAGLAAERQAPAGLDGVRYAARLAVFLGLCALLGTVAFAIGSGLGLRRVRVPVLVGWVAAFVGTVVHFVTQGPYAVGGSWSGIVDIGLWGDVWSTRNGRALVARLGLLAIFAALLALVRPGRTSTTWWRSSAALVGAGTIVSMSAAGHPGSSSLAGVSVAVDAVHLSAIVIWVGGILALAMARPSQDDAHLTGVFSRWATVAVPIAVATGLWQAWHLIGSWDDLTESSWGRALVVKTAFVVAAVTIGGMARWMVVNSLGSTIRRVVIVEMVVVLGILGSTAALVANPPRVVAEPAVFTASLVEGTTIVNVTVTPGRIGVNETHLTVQTPAGALSPVEGVTVRFSRAGSDVPPLDVPMEILGPNHYTGTVSLLAGGPWTMEILVQVDASSVTRLSTTVEIAG